MVLKSLIYPPFSHLQIPSITYPADRAYYLIRKDQFKLLPSGSCDHDLTLRNVTTDQGTDDADNQAKFYRKSRRKVP